jgi:hypothetical protein
MFKSQTAPMVKDSNQVHTTTDYFLFKSIDGNRNKNLLHLKRLKQSMVKNYLFTVIIVNEKYEIIDGQHRFEIIQELKLPLNYIICKGYGLNEVHLLNANSKNWTTEDYLAGYCDMGYPDYLKMRDFCLKHDLKISQGLILLSGNRYNDDAFINFRDGTWKIDNFATGEKIAYGINLIRPLYNGATRRTFVLALVKLYKNRNFEIVEFLSKLKIQPNALVHCINVDQYVALIEEIYNYRRREKVNLRY